MDIPEFIVNKARSVAEVVLFSGEELDVSDLQPRVAKVIHGGKVTVG